MNRIVALAGLFGGCVAEPPPPPSGVQIGEEEVQVPEVCLDTDQEVAPDEPAFPGGESALDLLSALAMSATVVPTWYDGATASLDVNLALDGEPIVLRTSEPQFETVCPAPALLFGLVSQIVSDDGRLDEAAPIGPVRLSPTEGIAALVTIDAVDIVGTLDADGIVRSVLGDVERSVGLSVDLSLEAGQPSHGALTVFGYPTSTEHPANPDETVTQVIASW